MLKNLPAPNYGDLDWKKVLVYLFLIALFIRFPFFFRDYIDRDESTFIIMGQAWVDGHLPYTKLWDLKPPITFLFFAAIIKVFGKSFIAIRLIGTLIVALTALFSYGMARKLVTKKTAFWTSVCCVGLLSLFGSLQGVMSEHISSFFFCAGTFLLLGRAHGGRYFVIGLLYGLSMMTKLNMVDPILFVGVFLLWEGFRKKRSAQTLIDLVCWGTGILLVILMTALPYYLQDMLPLWWESIFEAPLAYSEGKFHSPLSTLPFISVVLGVLTVGYWFKLLDIRSRELQLIGLICIGILLSFMQAGKINGHYLIQLHPLVLVPFGMMASKIPAVKGNFRPMVYFLLLLLPMEAHLEYANILGNKIKRGTFYNGEGYTVPQYIIDHKLDTRNIYFTEYHIGYWLLGTYPPTKAVTHPSNITRDQLFPYMGNPRKTGMGELRYIMERVRPHILVARDGKKIFDKKLTWYNAYIDAYLARHYRLLATVDQGLIYQRLE